MATDSFAPSSLLTNTFSLTRATLHGDKFASYPQSLALIELEDYFLFQEWLDSSQRLELLQYHSAGVIRVQDSVIKRLIGTEKTLGGVRSEAT